MREIMRNRESQVVMRLRVEDEEEQVEYCRVSIMERLEMACALRKMVTYLQEDIGSEESVTKC